ncbi:MAG: hypothetical protein R3F13_21525 [Prosthecobacter sp.]
MLIDWFTVIAQAVNFLILVWLLKRFLYKPVLDAIDAREKRIAAQLEDAAAKEAAAAKERDEFQRKNDDFAQQRDGMLKKVGEEAKAERQKLLEQARQEAEALKNKLQTAAQNERDGLSREITNRAQQEVFAIARKALSELAGANLEERMTEVFIQRLRGLDAGEKANLTAFLKTSHHPALVRTAFELSQPQRSAIEGAIKETLSTSNDVQFETSSALVSGIELTTNGHKVAWSIADYLASLERNVGELLDDTHGNEK